MLAWTPQHLLRCFTEYADQLFLPLVPLYHHYFFFLFQLPLQGCTPLMLGRLSPVLARCQTYSTRARSGPQPTWVLLACKMILQLKFLKDRNCCSRCVHLMLLLGCKQTGQSKCNQSKAMLSFNLLYPVSFWLVIASESLVLAVAIRSNMFESLKQFQLICSAETVGIVWI